MSTRRKTVKIKDLIDKVNYLNANSTSESAVREGWNRLLEDLLHENNVYNGFNYLHQHQVPEGEEPGVILGVNPEDNEFPDDTRRVYFVHPELRK